MSGELFDPDAQSRAVPGRGYPYATVGHWVLLAPGLSDRAVRLYAVLRMCADARTEVCWPGQRYLADLLGLAKTDSIGPAVRELEAVGAVDVETVRATRGRMNVYTVHEAPPDGYAGPTTQDEWRARNPRSDGVTPNRG